MAERSRGMGRGLAAILSVSDPGQARDELREIAVELIGPNPHQPRKHFDGESLGELAASIGASGVLQPVLVRPRPGGTFELIAGERRWRAAKLAGVERIPALVRPRDDAASLELALVENMAREDLNPVEEARACAALVEELGLTREEVGRRVGRSRVAVSNLVRLLDLPDDALELLESGSLTEGHGRALLLAPDNGDRRRLARDAAVAGWSVRELENRARAASSRPGTPTAIRPPATPLHPDEESAMAHVADALAAALGAEVAVKRRSGGYRVELRLDSIEDGLALSRRLRPRAVA